jgi:membrane protease YdiL (CAAX protease family)
MRTIEKTFLVLIFCWVFLENILENCVRAMYYRGFHPFHSILVSSLATTLLLLIPIWIELIRRGGFMEYYGLKFRWEMLTWIVLAVPIIVVMGFILDPARLAPRSELQMIENYIGYLPSLIAKIIAKQYSLIHALLISIIVTIPNTFIEELWFRGMIQFKISSIKTLGEASIPTSIVAQSLIFGLAHIYPVALNPHLPVLKTLVFLYAMLGGLILGIATYRFRSILPAWIIHTSVNIIAVASYII